MGILGLLPDYGEVASAGPVIRSGAIKVSGLGALEKFDQEPLKKILCGGVRPEGQRHPLRRGGWPSGSTWPRLLVFFDGFTGYRVRARCLGF